MRPFKVLTAKVQSNKKCIECPVSVGCAYCQAQNYDSSKNNTNFERATFSCDMHRARVKANNYFWAKMYNKYNYEREKEFSSYGSYERKMYFMLNGKCARLCANYTVTNDNTTLSTDKLLEGLENAKNNFCQPVFLHSDSNDFMRIISNPEILEKLEGYIIKHIIPYCSEDLDLMLNYVKQKDIIVTFDKNNIDTVSESCIKNCILVVDRNNLDKIYSWTKKLLTYYNRVNLKCKIQTFSDLNLYEEELKKITQLIIDYAKNGKIYEVNVITDRLFIDHMDNCFAGEKSITLAPNGKFIYCPAFYFSSVEDNYFNEADTFESEYNMTKLDKSPICKECDAYQCERCVYLNKTTTLEYNIPSELQCIKSHKEREITLSLKNELLKINENLKFREIKPVEYTDPCEKVIHMWNLV